MQRIECHAAVAVDDEAAETAAGYINRDRNEAHSR